MALSFKYKGHVENGVLKIQGRKGFDGDLKQFFEGKDVQIEIKKWRKSRSPKQNALFHVYVGIIAEETGMAFERVKRALKAQFLTVDILDEDGVPVTNPATGEVLKEVRDTSDLDTLEMFELCENVRLWAMDFNIYLESPNEQGELKF